MVLSGLIVVNDALVGGKDEETELSGRQDLVAELLEVLQLEIETRRDDTALVKSTVQINDDFTVSLVINDLELVDITVLLHASEELNNDLGDGSEHNLSMTVRINLNQNASQLCQVIP